MHSNRRAFLTAGALTAASYSRVLGANERIRVGLLGAGGRGTYLLEIALKQPGTELAAVCDVYAPRRESVRTRLGPAARESGDHRQVLDQKDIDAVIIGSPDHWHVPMTIDAVRAGKDVYVEKPLTHKLEEGPLVEKAVAETKRVVQVGYQQRSWDLFAQAGELIKSGKLGKITLILTSWYQNYVRMTEAPPDVDVSKLDWKRFCGNAPERAYDVLRFASWRWFWDYGGGHLTDLYSHWGDVVNWYMGTGTPMSAQGAGESTVLPKFECPDTVSVAWTYPRGLIVNYNGTLAGSLEGGGLVFRGSGAMMKLNRLGYQVWPENVEIWGAERYPAPEINVQAKGDGTVAHMQNFLECVRTRATPNSPVSSAVLAARTAQLGNQAIRRGERINLGG